MCWDTACSHIILPPRSAQTSTWTFTTQNTKWSKTQLAQQNFHQETYKSKLLYLECSISWLVTRGESMFGDSPNSESQPSLGRSSPHRELGPFQAHDHAAVPWIQQQAKNACWTKASSLWLIVSSPANACNSCIAILHERPAKYKRTTDNFESRVTFMAVRDVVFFATRAYRTRKFQT